MRKPSYKERALTIMESKVVKSIQGGAQSNTQALREAGYSEPRKNANTVIKRPQVQEALSQWKLTVDAISRQRFKELIIQDENKPVAARMVELGAKTAEWYSESGHITIIPTTYSELTKEQLEAKLDQYQLTNSTQLLTDKQVNDKD